MQWSSDVKQYELNSPRENRTFWVYSVNSFQKERRTYLNSYRNPNSSGLNSKSICRFSDWKTGGRKAPGTNAISSSMMSNKTYILSNPSLCHQHCPHSHDHRKLPLATGTPVPSPSFDKRKWEDAISTFFILHKNHSFFLFLQIGVTYPALYQ